MIDVRWWIGWLVVGVGLAACAGSRDDDPKHCIAMRDHLVDLRIAQSKGATDELGRPIDLGAHRAAMKQALGETFIGACRRDMTSAQIQCVLGASDSTSAAACTSSVSSSVK